MGWVNHGREHVTVLGHADNVLTGMGQVHWTLPCHDAKHVEREEHAGGVNLCIGMFQEVGNYVGPVPLWMLGLVDKEAAFWSPSPGNRT